MSGKGRIVVVDFDDTLFFVKECIGAASLELLGRRLSRSQLRELRPKEMKWKIYDLAFLKYSSLSKPNRRMINILSRERDAGTYILILTARPEKTKKETMALLRKYKVRFNSIKLRENGLAHSSDEEWKLGRINGLAERYGDITIYEDKRDNISYFKHGVLYPEKFRFVHVKE